MVFDFFPIKYFKPIIVFVTYIYAIKYKRFMQTMVHLDNYKEFVVKKGKGFTTSNLFESFLEIIMFKMVLIANETVGLCSLLQKLIYFNKYIIYFNKHI